MNASRPASEVLRRITFHDYQQVITDLISLARQQWPDQHDWTLTMSPEVYARLHGAKVGTLRDSEGNLWHDMPAYKGVEVHMMTMRDEIEAVSIGNYTGDGRLYLDLNTGLVSTDATIINNPPPNVADVAPYPTTDASEAADAITRLMTEHPTADCLRISGIDPVTVEQDHPPARTSVAPISDNEAAITAAVAALLDQDLGPDNPQIHADVDDWHIAAVHPPASPQLHVTFVRQNQAETLLRSLMADPNATELLITATGPATVSYADGSTETRDLTVDTRGRHLTLMYMLDRLVTVPTDDNPVRYDITDTWHVNIWTSKTEGATFQYQRG